LGIIKPADVILYRPPSKISDIMTKNVVTIDVSRPIIEGAKLMAESKVGGKGIGSLVVTRDSAVIGIVTERDYLERAVVKGIDVKRMPIKEIMSSPVITCSSKASIIEAARLMREYRVRHLPVLDDGKLVGIVAGYDLALMSPVIDIEKILFLAVALFILGGYVVLAWYAAASTPTLSGAIFLVLLAFLPLFAYIIARRLPRV